MPTLRSFAAAVAGFARLLCLAGRTAFLRFRSGARATRQGDGLILRAVGAAGSASPPLAATAGRPPLEETHTLRGEYRAIWLSEIVAAATPSRLLHENIDRLADSIAGSAERAGVGLLVPVVVRLLDGDRYALIDGDRRVRACALVAARDGATDCRIPALVFRVSAHDALLMRLATLDSAEPKPFELARTYRALCDAMAEAGDHACTARGLTMVSHHGKTQIAGYLRIADAVSDEVIVAAGLVSSNGDPTPEPLARLTNSQLLDAAKCDTVESRAAAIRGLLGRPRGRGTTASSAERGGTHDDTPDVAARTKERALSLMARSRKMSPGEARTLIEQELAPAMLALVEQAHGRRDAEGYYSAFTIEHACLVLPREVEGLTLEQLNRLDHALTMLAARTRRALEERQQVGEAFAPVAARKTS